MMAAMLAKKKSAKKGKKDDGKGKGKGKGKKGPTAKAPEPKAAAAESSAKKEEDEPVLDKAQKIAVDKKQLFSYLQQARDLKA
jgi:hypothetical protein